ncbi:TetR/AcrR family transcriptional regulator [Candidatus Xianfuyuplasma coldseepsis]|uniref:TetR/AcrR family transcriptional regulator n=1 Tax=Candidatus Xianfuyuplasma coldseepsis TaxID=2782163 RepID=A0A7L7KTC7_9MOLU|nr:TetR/AcrR family transcriptional regulator [Xianfuyuplasma coldseepsis]QMS85659.1 TetR/AcrR family transcriptional regulator [Xianfuyuplasma coldseepsis]
MEMAHISIFLLTNRPKWSILRIGGDSIHKFDDFTDSRKNDLINTGFEEFATHGYKRASLNHILQRSRIPKGLFYHYFANKEDLYTYLYQFGINVITKRLIDSSVLMERDYINRLIASYMIKVEAYHDYQFFDKFLMKVYRDDNNSFLETIHLEDSKEYGRRFIEENIASEMFLHSDMTANIRVASRYMQQTFNDIINRIHVMSKEDIKTYLDREAQYLRCILYKEEYHD